MSIVGKFKQSSLHMYTIQYYLAVSAVYSWEIQKVIIRIDVSGTHIFILQMCICWRPVCSRQVLNEVKCSFNCCLIPFILFCFIPFIPSSSKFEDKSHTYVQIEISESYQSHYNDRSRISQIRGERQFQRQEHTVCGNIFAKIFIKMKEIGLTEGPYIPSSPCSDQDIREIWLTSYLQTDCVPSNVPMLMFRLSWFHLPSFSLNTLFASDILFQLN